MLTVREVLSFQAQLRVPAARHEPPPGQSGQASAASSSSASLGGGEGGAGGLGACEERVASVLARMKLVRCAETIVGNEFKRGLSGGEKRRVSVAIELLSEPAILFLDEPTTGQDSTTAVMLCKALKRIAKVGGVGVEPSLLL